jgi:peptidoglycan/xylan/chitin deacetylase (PgdA/CDA1 family)
MKKRIIFATVLFCVLLVGAFRAIGNMPKLELSSEAGQSQPAFKYAVLKLDDVVAGRGGTQIVPERWQKVADYLEGKKIKSSMGIIGFSLVDDNPAYFKWITDRAKRGYIEFWNHGFKNRGADDPGEFEGGYEEQLRALRLTDSLATSKLGLVLSAWGPHWSGSNENTDRALAQLPQIRIVFGQPRGAVHFKGFVMPRHIDIEFPTHNTDFEAFKKAYQAGGFRNDYTFLQGHPNSWDDVRWDNFVKIIEFLQAEGVQFVTPSELLAILEARK